MIGLKRNTVRIVQHDAAWVATYELEARRIKGAIGSDLKGIEHIGSTSVPGLPAKPIIDIALGIDNVDVLRLVKDVLTSNGYIDRGETGNGDYLFVKESAPDVRTVHLHVVPFNSRKWKAYIGFRDALRSNQSLAEQYNQLKLELAGKYANERRSYTAAKEAFINVVLTASSL